MPKNKDLKRQVRARMHKTGESYTAARSQVVGRSAGGGRSARETRDLAAIAGMSDAAVKAKTDRTWKQCRKMA